MNCGKKESRKIPTHYAAVNFELKNSLKDMIGL
jgi:hypothetical protein